MTKRVPLPRTFTPAHRRRLDRAAEHYLRRCYRTNTAARAAEFAAELDLTPEEVRRLASEILGKPLLDYLREKQVTYAAWLLRILPPEITIEEISRRSAFGTPAIFRRCFLEVYGTTPGAFRAR
jgi:AraC-like DNA-binding protein